MVLVQGLQRVRAALVPCLFCGLICYGIVGCGGAKIKDYDEALPIPDIPIAGGGGGDQLGQEPSEGESAELEPTQNSARRTAPEQRNSSFNPAASPPEPTEAAEFD